METLAEELGCKAYSLPSTYLGLPLGSRNRSVCAWDGVGQRLRKRLAKWKRQHISKGERATLITSTMSSLPIYYMSILHMPRVVRLRLDHIQRNVLAGGGNLEKKSHLVNWATVYMSKEYGGVGVKNLRVPQ